VGSCPALYITKKGALDSQPQVIKYDTILLAPYHTFYSNVEEHMNKVGVGSSRNLWDQPLCVGKFVKCSHRLIILINNMAGLGGSMSWVVGLPNNSYKPITNTAWVRARLCTLQKKVHSTLVCTTSTF
jgi:hypothetical protein